MSALSPSTARGHASLYKLGDRQTVRTCCCCKRQPWFELSHLDQDRRWTASCHVAKCKDEVSQVDQPHAATGQSSPAGSGDDLSCRCGRKPRDIRRRCTTQRGGYLRIPAVNTALFVVQCRHNSAIVRSPLALFAKMQHRTCFPVAPNEYHIDGTTVGLRCWPLSMFSAVFTAHATRSASQNVCAVDCVFCALAASAKSIPELPSSAINREDCGETVRRTSIFILSISSEGGGKSPDTCIMVSRIMGEFHFNGAKIGWHCFNPL